MSFHPVLRPRLRRFATAAAVALVLGSGSGLLVACGPSAPRLEPPAKVVDELLQARAENVTDRTVYERLMESTEVAQALVDDAASRPATLTPIPEWYPPKVTKETSSAAQVTVEWRFQKGFENWPARSVFGLLRHGKRWFVVEAVESTTTVQPPKNP